MLRLLIVVRFMPLQTNNILEFHREPRELRTTAVRTYQAPRSSRLREGSSLLPPFLPSFLPSFLLSLTHSSINYLTLLGPQSRFGDKLLTGRVLCPHRWECGAIRVEGCTSVMRTEHFELELYEGGDKTLRLRSIPRRGQNTSK